MTQHPDHPQPPADALDDEDAIDLLFLTDAVQEDETAEEQTGYPIIAWLDGQPVPDSTRSPRNAGARC